MLNFYLQIGKYKIKQKKQKHNQDNKRVSFACFNGRTSFLLKRSTISIEAWLQLQMFPHSAWKRDCKRVSVKNVFARLYQVSPNLGKEKARERPCLSISHIVCFIPEESCELFFGQKLFTFRDENPIEQHAAGGKKNCSRKRTELARIK